MDSIFIDNSPVFMAHVYYGDPTIEFSLRQVETLIRGGVDIIELGIPFSDPTADGPVFQRACQRALENDVTPDNVIEGIRQIRSLGITNPIIVTTYYNIIFRMGIQLFVDRIKDAGAVGLIVPNIPFEEADELLDACKEVGLHLIFLVAPTTTERRLKEILKRASGFLYLVSVTGVTGARDNLEESTLGLVRRVREYSDIPLMVGFGISTPEHASQVVRAGANGVIVGSAIGSIYERDLAKPENTLGGIQAFTKGIKEIGVD
jgi:tryptophan synthase alpha chain